MGFRMTSFGKAQGPVEVWQFSLWAVVRSTPPQTLNIMIHTHFGIRPQLIL